MHFLIQKLYQNFSNVWIFCRSIFAFCFDSCSHANLRNVALKFGLKPIDSLRWRLKLPLKVHCTVTTTQLLSVNNNNEIAEVVEVKFLHSMSRSTVFFPSLPPFYLKNSFYECVPLVGQRPIQLVQRELQRRPLIQIWKKQEYIFSIWNLEQVGKVMLKRSETIHCNPNESWCCILSSSNSSSIMQWLLSICNLVMISLKMKNNILLLILC